MREGCPELLPASRTACVELSRKAPSEKRRPTFSYVPEKQVVADSRTGCFAMCPFRRADVPLIVMRCTVRIVLQGAGKRLAGYLERDLELRIRIIDPQEL